MARGPGRVAQSSSLALALALVPSSPLARGPMSRTPLWFVSRLGVPWRSGLPSLGGAMPSPPVRPAWSPWHASVKRLHASHGHEKYTARGIPELTQRWMATESNASLNADPEKWSVEDVVQWAETVVDREDAVNLRPQKVDGSALLDMTKEDLERYGIPGGPATKLVKAIKSLMKARTKELTAEAIVKKFGYTQQKPILAKEALTLPFEGRDEVKRQLEDAALKLFTSWKENSTDQKAYPIPIFAGAPGIGKTRVIHESVALFAPSDSRAATDPTAAELRSFLTSEATLKIHINFGNGQAFQPEEASNVKFAIASRLLHAYFCSHMRLGDFQRHLQHAITDLSFEEAESIVVGHHRATRNLLTTEPVALVLGIDEFGRLIEDGNRIPLKQCLDLIGSSMAPSPGILLLPLLAGTARADISEEFGRSTHPAKWIASSLLSDEAVERIVDAFNFPPLIRKSPHFEQALFEISGHPRTLQHFLNYCSEIPMDTVVNAVIANDSVSSQKKRALEVVRSLYRQAFILGAQHMKAVLPLYLGDAPVTEKTMVNETSVGQLERVGLIILTAHPVFEPYSRISIPLLFLKIVVGNSPVTTDPFVALTRIILHYGLQPHDERVWEKVALCSVVLRAWLLNSQRKSCVPLAEFFCATQRHTNIRDSKLMVNVSTIADPSGWVNLPVVEKKFPTEEKPSYAIDQGTVFLNAPKAPFDGWWATRPFVVLDAKYADAKTASVVNRSLLKDNVENAATAMKEHLPELEWVHCFLCLGILGPKFSFEDTEQATLVVDATTGVDFYGPLINKLFRRELKKQLAGKTD